MEEGKYDLIYLHKFYNQISDINYKHYKYFKQKYDNLTNDNKEWDILSHIEKDNKNYFEYFNNYKYYAFISIVFKSLSIEAYINDFGARKLGYKKFNEHYEKMNTIDKYVIIYETINKKEFPKNMAVYGKLKKLIKIRNTLIHSKSSKINMQGPDNLKNIKENLGNFMDNLQKPFGELFDEIDKLNNIYNELIEIMENSKRKYTKKSLK